MIAYLAYMHLFSLETLSVDHLSAHNDESAAGLHKKVSEVPRPIAGPCVLDEMSSCLGFVEAVLDQELLKVKHHLGKGRGLVHICLCMRSEEALSADRYTHLCYTRQFGAKLCELRSPGRLHEAPEHIDDDELRGTSFSLVRPPHETDRPFLNVK
jgi:hypothetical protein